MQNEPSKPSDEEVVRQVLEGNVNAFEVLLKRYRVQVMRIVGRHVPHQDAEETAQEAFVRAYTSLPTFEGRGGFGQWLSSIAVRTCHDYWRKAYRSRELPMSTLTEKHREWLEDVLSGESEQSRREEDTRSEAAEFLDRALENLRAEDRMVLELVYLEGLSVKEAAELLGWTAVNVKVRSFRSRRKLEKLLKGVMQKGRGVS
jgi:RNA polymerase sigma-70 factor (ECF subfamily)